MEDIVKSEYVAFILFHVLEISNEIEAMIVV